MPVTIRNITKTFLISCNLVASGLLLILYCQPYIHPGYFWWLNLLAIGLPALLLLQGGFLFFWLLVKRKLTLIPLLTVAFSWPLVTSFYAVGGMRSTQHSQDFRVASWNAHLLNFYENKGSLDPEMIAHARAMKADMLLLQEFVFSLNEKSSFSLDAVRRKLGYRYAVAANDSSFGVHAHKRKPEERYHPFCVALFSNYPIIRWEKIKTENRYNYTFLWADVKVNKDTVRIFNIHLQTMHFAQGDYEFIENINDKNLDEVKRTGGFILRKMRVAYYDRAEQAKVIAAAVAESPYPVVLGGDFNDVPQSYAYSLIDRELDDAFTRSGTGIGRTFMRLSPSLRIDYLFSSPELQPLRARAVRPALSDHLPVVADFLLPGK